MRISFRCCFGTVLEEATKYPSSSVVVLRFLAFRLHFVFALGIMMMDRLIALTMQEEDTSLPFFQDAKCQRSSLLLRLIAPSAMPYQSIVTLSA